MKTNTVDRTSKQVPMTAATALCLISGGDLIPAGMTQTPA